MLRTPVSTRSNRHAAFAGLFVSSPSVVAFPEADGATTKPARVGMRNRIAENLESALVLFVLARHEALSLHSHQLAPVLDPVDGTSIAAIADPTNSLTLKTDIHSSGSPALRVNGRKAGNPAR